MPDPKKNAAAPARGRAARRITSAATIIVPPAEARKCSGCGIPIATAWLCRTCLSWHWAAVYLEAARNAIERVTP